MAAQRENIMTKIARFIVDKRMAFFIFFVVAVIYCVASIGKVRVNNDMTSYLPADTETRRGIAIMSEEYSVSATGQIMIANISFEQAQALADDMGEVEGIAMVTFDDTESHYKNASALFDLTFSAEEDDPVSIAAMEEIRGMIAGYDAYVNCSVGIDELAILQDEMTVILMIAMVVIVAVLLLTSRSYLEIVVFILVFGVAAVLNMGTNYWFGEISFITNSIAVVLQLALAVDYSIILCHRFMDEREKKEPRDAMIKALSEAIVEIASSSLTTIAGLLALTVMQLRIGFDIGIVMTKGIVCSLLTVFLLMPGLLMMFGKGIDKTHHRSFVPHIRGWGRLIVKTRYILPPIFIVVLVASFFLSGHGNYVYSVEMVQTGKPSVERVAADKIVDTFGYKNTIAMLVPVGDYEAEGAILREVGAMEGVASATGLANIEVDDQYVVTDKVSPRQFAELAGIEVELSRLLFQAYGISVGEYGAIFQNPDDYTAPLINVFQFLIEQKDAGVVSLDGEQEEMIDEVAGGLISGLSQLEGENWSRLVFTADVPIEGEETYALLDKMKAAALKHYDDAVLVGASTNARDLSDSFQGDNLLISVLTAVFLLIILLFTFRSAGLPVLLVATIQGSVWINFSFPYLTGTTVFFLGYLIVSAIQMGATIDYAIVITNRYMNFRKTMDRREAVIEALDSSFATVITSGTMLASAGYLISAISTDVTINYFGSVIGRGTLTSMVLVMTVLPQFLFLGDKLIAKTSFSLRDDDARTETTRSVLYLDGHVKGQLSGYVDAEMKGLVSGDIDAQIDAAEGLPPPSAEDGEQEARDEE